MSSRKLKILCCGHQQDTLFCCHCGKPLLASSPLASLLFDLRHKADLARKNKEKRDALAARPIKEKDGFKEQMELRSRKTHQVYAMTAETRANRYQIWADALQQLMESK